jgi:hypothetical protein
MSACSGWNRSRSGRSSSNPPYPRGGYHEELPLRDRTAGFRLRCRRQQDWDNRIGDNNRIGDRDHCVRNGPCPLCAPCRSQWSLSPLRPPRAPRSHRPRYPPAPAVPANACGFFPIHFAIGRIIWRRQRAIPRHTRGTVPASMSLCFCHPRPSRCHPRPWLRAPAGKSGRGHPVGMLSRRPGSPRRRPCHHSPPSGQGANFWTSNTGGSRLRPRRDRWRQPILPFFFCTGRLLRQYLPSRIQGRTPGFLASVETPHFPGASPNGPLTQSVQERERQWGEYERTEPARSNAR